MTPELAARLISEQFPQWSHLPVTQVIPGGRNNRTFRLGDEMLVRLPSEKAYEPQVMKEQQWLPKLAPHLPLPIPTPLAMGAPTEEYPLHWSVYNWIEGESADTGHIDDMVGFAVDLANFLNTLRTIDTTDAPPPGPHNFYRGDHPSVYDSETQDALQSLSGSIDTDTAQHVWQEALSTRWTGPPMWIHGDVSIGNLLVNDGRLSSVIDFGITGTGDPACDLVMAWTFFSGESREAFRATIDLDETTWMRARGWALWKALITIARQDGFDPLRVEEAGRTVGECLVLNP